MCVTKEVALKYKGIKWLIRILHSGCHCGQFTHQADADALRRRHLKIYLISWAPLQRFITRTPRLMFDTFLLLQRGDLLQCREGLAVHTASDCTVVELMHQVIFLLPPFCVSFCVSLCLCPPVSLSPSRPLSHLSPQTCQALSEEKQCGVI